MSEQKPLETYDLRYDPTLLEYIRSHVHRTMISKHTLLTRSDYIIYFDEDGRNDIEYLAGKKIAIILSSSPFNGDRVSRLLNSVLSNTTILKKLRQTTHVVRQKDAMLWYRVEMEQILAHYQKVKDETDISRFTTKILSAWQVVEVTDRITKKTVRVTVKNGDAFTLTDTITRMMKE